MADALIETTSTNPYESIVADTTNQINSIQEDIQKVSNAISKLESTNPTHYLLPQLRERLSELQSKMTSLNNTNDSAKSLLTSYNDSLKNANTMQWLYQLKQAELNRAQQEADRTYRQMSEDVKRSWENYINALWSATASENAIINANAWLQWASAQSTAEARARNYLANAQAQAEANANMVSNLNAINDSRLNSNAWYVQLSQSNADNTLRQQIMNDYDAAQNASRSWYWSWSWSKITLPDTVKKENKWWEESTDNSSDTTTNTTEWQQWYQDTEEDKKIKEDTKKVAMEVEDLKYWTILWWPWVYHNNIKWTVSHIDPNNSFDASYLWNALNSNAWWSKLMVDLDRKKTNAFLKEWNSKRDLDSTYAIPTDKWYLYFYDGNWNKKIAYAKDLMEWNPDKIWLGQQNWNWVIRKV